MNGWSPCRFEEFDGAMSWRVQFKPLRCRLSQGFRLRREDRELRDLAMRLLRAME